MFLQVSCIRDEGAKNGTSFFEFSLYLSRACLGKMIVFMYKWLQKCRFSQETLADDEVMKADRRGSKMLAIDRLYIKVHTTISISRYYI